MARSLLVAQVMAAMFAAVFSIAAQARDVSAQQAGVEYARHEVGKADELHKANLEELHDAEKVLAKRKKAFELQAIKVAGDRKKAKLSKRSLTAASKKLKKAQAILDQAWK